MAEIIKQNFKYYFYGTFYSHQNNHSENVLRSGHIDGKF